MEGKLITMTSLLKKRRKEKLDKLHNKLEILEKLHKNSVNSNVKIEMKMKKNEIYEIYAQEIQKK